MVLEFLEPKMSIENIGNLFESLDRRKFEETKFGDDEKIMRERWYRLIMVILSVTHLCNILFQYTINICNPALIYVIQIARYFIQQTDNKEVHVPTTYLDSTMCGAFFILFICINHFYLWFFTKKA